MTSADYTEPRWYTEIKYWQSVDYRDGYAYVIRAGEDGPIKVGKAFDPEARMKELQTGCWLPLQILHVLPGYGRTEARYHRELKDYRLEGEWFDGPVIDGFLKKVAQDSTRFIRRNMERGEIPMPGKAPRVRSQNVTGTYTGHGLRRSSRMKPTEDAPVTVRFVDPSELEPPKGGLPSRYGSRNDLLDDAA